MFHLECTFLEHNAFPKGKFSAPNWNSGCSKWEWLIFPAFILGMNTKYLIVFVNGMFLLGSSILHRVQISVKMCYVHYKLTSSTMTVHL